MLSRNLDKAKAAYKNKDAAASKVAHVKKSGQAAEQHNNSQGKYIKSLIYGGLDGIITTFAVVAGVAGAALTPGIVLILGFANLIADGLSMAIGDYLSTKAENEYNESERQRELWEVENYPEGEKLELIELYIAKGYEEKDAKELVELISKNKTGWVDIMMVEELGILQDDESPLNNALVTLLSFVVFGFIPLLAYVLSGFIPAFGANTFMVATVLTGITLFVLGALKVRITDKNWLVSGCEMLLVGGLAAAAAYTIGALLSGLA